MKVSCRPTIMSGVVYDIQDPGGSVVSVGREGVSMSGPPFNARLLDRMAGMLAHVSSSLNPVGLRMDTSDPGLRWVQTWLYTQGFKVDDFDPAKDLPEPSGS